VRKTVGEVAVRKCRHQTNRAGLSFLLVLQWVQCSVLEPSIFWEMVSIVTCLGAIATCLHPASILQLPIGAVKCQQWASGGPRGRCDLREGQRA